MHDITDLICWIYSTLPPPPTKDIFQGMYILEIHNVWKNQHYLLCYLRMSPSSQITKATLWNRQSGGFYAHFPAKEINSRKLSGCFSEMQSLELDTERLRCLRSGNRALAKLGLELYVIFWYKAKIWGIFS